MILLQFHGIMHQVPQYSYNPIRGIQFKNIKDFPNKLSETSTYKTISNEESIR